MSAFRAWQGARDTVGYVRTMDASIVARTQPCVHRAMVMAMMVVTGTYNGDGGGGGRCNDDDGGGGDGCSDHFQKFLLHAM